MPTCSVGPAKAAELRKQREAVPSPDLSGSAMKRGGSPPTRVPSPKRKHNRRVLRSAARDAEVSSVAWAVQQIQNGSADDLRRELEVERRLRKQCERQLREAHKQLEELRRRAVAGHAHACDACCMALPIAISRVLELEAELSNSAKSGECGMGDDDGWNQHSDDDILIL